MVRWQRPVAGVRKDSGNHFDEVVDQRKSAVCEKVKSGGEFEVLWRLGGDDLQHECHDCVAFEDLKAEGTCKLCQCTAVTLIQGPESYCAFLEQTMFWLSHLQGPANHEDRWMRLSPCASTDDYSYLGGQDQV